MARICVLICVGVFGASLVPPLIKDFFGTPTTAAVHRPATPAALATRLADGTAAASAVPGETPSWLFDTAVTGKRGQTVEAKLMRAN